MGEEFAAVRSLQVGWICFLISAQNTKSNW